MSVGMSWLVIGLVVLSVWGFWLWLGSIFDAISDYYHSYSSADESREAEPTTWERGD